MGYFIYKGNSQWPWERNSFRPHPAHINRYSTTNVPNNFGLGYSEDTQLNTKPSMSDQQWPWESDSFCSESKRERERDRKREWEKRQRERDTHREKEREKNKRESRPSSFQLIQCCHVYNTTKVLDEFGQDNSGLDWTPSHQCLTNKSLVSGLGKVTCFVQGKRPRERERRPNSSQQWQCCHECNTTKVPDEFRQGYSGLS